jgi:SAM-dependent methyltransferase
MKNIMIQHILRILKEKMRRIYYFPKDTLDALLSRRDELTPPKGMVFTGRGDFKKIGQEFLQYFIELGELKQNDRVLDVGCGIGRMAVPLIKYLNGQDSYEGFDLDPIGVNWCKKKITPKYPNFHFQLADIYNKKYNPKGKYTGSEYRFPYKDKSFDFVLSISVLTHMLPKDMENYISEISRVLDTGKKCLITFFLLNEESLKLIDAKSSILDFRFNLSDGCKTIDSKVPEKAIAYDEIFVRMLHEKYKLDLVEPIHYGSWCGRNNYLSFQDIIIAVKTNEAA